MRDYLSLIDRDTPGNRDDVTPLFRDAAALQRAASDLAELARATSFTVVASVDALGFVIGTAVAVVSGTGLVPLRKGGKLPVIADRVEFRDYDGVVKSLELRKGALERGDRVLIVDEWIETGAQALAAASLVEGQRATVAGVATIHCDGAGWTRLTAKYRVLTLERD